MLKATRALSLLLLSLLSTTVAAKLSADHRYLKIDLADASGLLDQAEQSEPSVDQYSLFKKVLIANSGSGVPQSVKNNRRRDNDNDNRGNFGNNNNNNADSADDNSDTGDFNGEPAVPIPAKPTRKIGPPPVVSQPDADDGAVKADAPPVDQRPGWGGNPKSVWGDDPQQGNQAKPDPRFPFGIPPGVDPNKPFPANDGKAKGYNNAQQAKPDPRFPFGIPPGVDPNKPFPANAEKAKGYNNAKPVQQVQQPQPNPKPPVAGAPGNAGKQPVPATGGKAQGYNKAKQNTGAIAKTQPPLNALPNAKRVYNGTITEFFNGSRKADVEYAGRVEWVNLKGPDGKTLRDDFGQPVAEPMLISGDQLGELGKRLGGGANSVVYLSKSRPKELVNKFVRITDNNGNLRPSKERTITDQAVGRQILKDLKKLKPKSPFRIAKQEGKVKIWKKTDKFGITHRFALTRDENISSPIYHSNGAPFVNKDGSPVTVTNAADRIAERGRYLSLKEELTINMVIRELNQNGIVWTDHKLENLDIVKDNSSVTGYRVIFFDFDAFRPVVGDSRRHRYKVARDMQKFFDNIEKHERAGQKAGVDIHNYMDWTVFANDSSFSYLYTPGANTYRKEYKDFDRLDARTFNKALFTSTGNNTIGVEFE
ncbi:MAG: hypothetical protein N0C81_15230 [Candidatus Thiodiazotropha lotti]|nr:hypothetical protein [Candidatus Thiodiazotropha lotti]MCG8004462.1 hypothetical protein [Candidatus Thiodiazotropha lotti]MCG8008980.1 hypothetical protein [Candidatus Thiodiazotropha lotti]MCW4188086.1 hypothetical protein [Candidatus Thiodiazotropha lotti]MCW4196570.1 hypothetical protein [Candidatus Thiodiazotropha lotti]